jgi:thiamine-monophosphate kinase
MGEFDLIEKYFKRRATLGAGVPLGIGDDCALLAPEPGMQLAVSSDMLVEGRHFLSTVNPAALGHKALAVNLSDLAACGAKPLGFTLALAMPRVDEAWLEGFSQGLFALADSHGCSLVGGDTTAGPLNICVTVFGQVPQGQALLRSGAKPGDDIYVSGVPGGARLALEAFRGKLQLSQEAFEAARARMEQPTARVALGIALRGLASSCIDVSDGLLGDLSHILRTSSVMADIELNAIDSIANDIDFTAAPGQNRSKILQDMILAGGDDYELAFTAPQALRSQVQAAAKAVQTRITRIGRVLAQQQAAGAARLRLMDANGQAVQHSYSSFDHFK